MSHAATSTRVMTVVSVRGFTGSPAIASGNQHGKAVCNLARGKRLQWRNGLVYLRAAHRNRSAPHTHGTRGELIDGGFVAERD